MGIEKANESVRVLAHSPGKYPIVVIERQSNELCTAYFETGYDLGHTKPVEKDWLTENAIGRHSFVELTPPAETPAASLADYVRSELLEES
jgi:hypothetical protein